MSADLDKFARDGHLKHQKILEIKKEFEILFDSERSSMGSIGIGWAEILIAGLRNIKHLVETSGCTDYPKITAIKEKFADLRIYLSFYPLTDDARTEEDVSEVASAVAQMYTNIMKQIDGKCELCGKDGNAVGRHWIRTLCPEHAQEQEELENHDE